MSKQNTKQATAGLISRRTVIQRTLMGMGYTSLALSPLLNSACATRETLDAAKVSEAAIEAGRFSAQQIAWLDEVAETILPRTDTPGAKDAQVGAFIALMVTDTYSPERQQTFAKGMADLESDCRQITDKGFLDCSAAERTQVLTQIDRTAWEQAQEEGQKAQTNPGYEPEEHYFAPIKSLTLLGYFTSEIGYTQAMRYVEAPGRWDPCVPYTEGEKAWAPHA